MVKLTTGRAVPARSSKRLRVCFSVKWLREVTGWPGGARRRLTIAASRLEAGGAEALAELGPFAGRPIAEVVTHLRYIQRTPLVQTRHTHGAGLRRLATHPATVRPSQDRPAAGTDTQSVRRHHNTNWLRQSSVSHDRPAAAAAQTDRQSRRPHTAFTH